MLSALTAAEDECLLSYSYAIILSFSIIYMSYV